MRKLRLSDLASRITLIAIAIAVGATAVVYVYVVAIGGSGSGDESVKLEILTGGLIAVAIATVIGLYYTRTRSGSPRAIAGCSGVRNCRRDPSSVAIARPRPEPPALSAV